MTNYSTLIYCIKNFQTDLDRVNPEVFEPGIDGFLENSTSVTVSAPERAVNNILNFARSYEVLKTEKTGYAELILN